MWYDNQMRWIRIRVWNGGDSYCLKKLNILMTTCSCDFPGQLTDCRSWQHTSEFWTFPLGWSEVWFVCSSFVVQELSYASPAWWGLTSAADRDRLDAFLRQSTALGFLSGHSSNAGHNLFWGWRQTVRGDCTQRVPPSSSPFTTQAWDVLLAEAPCTRLHPLNSNYVTQWQ